MQALPPTDGSRDVYCGMETNGAEMSRDFSQEMLVFFCEQCQSIVGDATNWLSASVDQQLFTLSAVTDMVTVEETLQHSTDAQDSGSSYYLLACSKCNAKIGRQYVTTPSHLDHLRDNFTLHVPLMGSYQLGSAQVKVTAQGHDPPLLLKMMEKVMKLQHLIVTLNMRLSAVEDVLRDAASVSQADK